MLHLAQTTAPQDRRSTATMSLVRRTLIDCRRDRSLENAAAKINGFFGDARCRIEGLFGQPEWDGRVARNHAPKARRLVLVALNKASQRSSDPKLDSRHLHHEMQRSEVTWRSLLSLVQRSKRRGEKRPDRNDSLLGPVPDRVMSRAFDHLQSCIRKKSDVPGLKRRAGPVVATAGKDQDRTGEGEARRDGAERCGRVAPEGVAGAAAETPCGVS